MKRFIKNDINYTLYLVADIELSNSLVAFFKTVEEAILGGVTIVQLRAKKLTTREFLSVAKVLKEKLLKINVPLIINDRVDIALAVDADGVHIGPNDLPPDVTRKILGPSKIIGYSCDNPEEAVKVIDIVDYLGVGDVFGTSTKHDAGEVIGVEGILRITRAVNIPVVAIGGINKENVHLLKNTGIAGIAVASAIMKAENPREQSKILKKIFLDP